LGLRLLHRRAKLLVSVAVLKEVELGRIRLTRIVVGVEIILSHLRKMILAVIILT
jgi:hypothetical protein